MRKYLSDVHFFLEYRENEANISGRTQIGICLPSRFPAFSGFVVVRHILWDGEAHSVIQTLFMGFQGKDIC